MKIAKEMFEDVGFTLYVGEYESDRVHTIDYSRPNHDFVVFHLTTRKIQGCFELDADVLDAIEQQKKELGWIE